MKGCLQTASKNGGNVRYTCRVLVEMGCAFLVLARLSCVLLYFVCAFVLLGNGRLRNCFHGMP